MWRKKGHWFFQNNVGKLLDYSIHTFTCKPSIKTSTHLANERTSACVDGHVPCEVVVRVEHFAAFLTDKGLLRFVVDRRIGAGACASRTRLRRGRRGGFRFGHRQALLGRTKRRADLDAAGQLQWPLLQRRFRSRSLRGLRAFEFRAGGGGSGGGSGLIEDVVPQRRQALEVAHGRYRVAEVEQVLQQARVHGAVDMLLIEESAGGRRQTGQGGILEAQVHRQRQRQSRAGEAGEGGERRGGGARRAGAGREGCCPRGAPGGAEGAGGRGGTWSGQARAADDLFDRKLERRVRHLEDLEKMELHFSLFNVESKI